MEYKRTMKHIKKIFLLVGFLSLSGGLKAQDAAWVQEVINSSSFKDDIEVIDLPLNELRVTGECHRGHKKRRTRAIKTNTLSKILLSSA